MSFGEKLKQARTRKGLTQRELAEIMKVSKNTITSWEIGTREPNVLSIKQLLSVLGLSADELLETSQEEKAPALQKAERELSDLDKRIISLLPLVPENVKEALLLLCEATCVPETAESLAADPEVDEVLCAALAEHTGGSESAEERKYS